MLVEPRSDCLPYTQGVTRAALTSSYHGKSRRISREQGSRRGPSRTELQGPDLVKGTEVELRGLEPLASCMPFTADLSGAVA